jgi:hypothetical protein
MEKIGIRDKHTGSATMASTLLSPAMSWPGISSSLLSPSLCRKIPCKGDTIYFIPKRMPSPLPPFTRSGEIGLGCTREKGRGAEYRYLAISHVLLGRGGGRRGQRNSSGGADKVKGGGRAPSPSASWAENTIMTECTQESGLLRSTYCSL